MLKVSSQVNTERTIVLQDIYLVFSFQLQDNSVFKHSKINGRQKIQFFVCAAIKTD